MPRGDITIGDLRHRATIQVPTDAPDTAGQILPTWADHSTVWALFEPTGGTEIVVGEQVRSIITGTVTARANPAFSPKRRLKVNGSGLTDLVLNIAAVNAPNPHTGFQVLVVEQPSTGIIQ